VRFPLCTCHRQYPGAATGCLVCSLPQPYQPSPIRVPGRPTHRPFRGLLGVHSRYGLHTRTVTVFRDSFTEGFNRFVTSTVAPVASGWSISPGGTLTHWKAPPFHGAPRKRTPIDRPLVKWRAKPLTRRGVEIFTVVSPRASCLSFSWLHIGGRCAPDTHLDQVRTHRSPGSDGIGPRLIRAPESPRYPQPFKGYHSPQGLAPKRRPSPSMIRRRGASSQQPCMEAMPG